MKILSTLTALSLSVAAINAQIVTYDIPFSQTIGLQQTTGDICSPPFSVEEAFQVTAGNSWGFTWTSTNSGTPTSVEITLGFTVTDGGGTFPTTLNGVAGFNVMDGTAKSCENSTILTWNVDPTNYNSGALNTFMVDFASATNVSQVDNLPFPGDPFFRVTVDYTPCPAVDTTVTQNGSTLTSGASNATYQWYDCETGMIISGETGVSFTATSSGEYAVIVTDTPSGCSDTSACVTVNLTGINDLELGEANIYPNPVENDITISLNGFEGNVNVVIYDLQGRVILTENTSIQGKEPIILNLEELVSGQYQLQVTSKQKIATTRFFKK